LLHKPPRTLPTLGVRWSVLVAALPMIGCQQAHSDFPSVDQKRLSITLQRSACYGTCPDYKVVINGEGRVMFTTNTAPTDATAGVHREFSRSVGVVVGGTHYAKIEPAQVKALLDRARSAQFFALKSEYRAEMTDMPTYVVSINTGYGLKSVIDYGGINVGMPRAEKNLEDAIDEVAGTKRWTEGSAEVIPLLRKERVDFAGPIGAALMSAAAARDDVPVMAQLKQLGTPLHASAGFDPLSAAAGASALPAVRFLVAQGAATDNTSLGNAIESAVRANNNQVFRFLLAEGGDRLITKNVATRLLPAAAHNGNLEISSFLINAGADVRGPEDRRRYDDPPVFAAAQGDFTLDETGERLAVVALLLEHGANIHQCSLGCSSVLASVTDPMIARLLINAGADPNFKDSEGEPILFSISDEDVALELIRAGARLDAVRPADKMTLRGWAAYQKWPKVLALLSQHGR